MFVDRIDVAVAEGGGGESFDFFGKKDGTPFVVFLPLDLKSLDDVLDGVFEVIKLFNLLDVSESLFKGVLLVLICGLLIKVLETAWAAEAPDASRPLDEAAAAMAGPPPVA